MSSSFNVHNLLEYREFCERFILPHAKDIDRQQTFPLSLIRELANAGYLGATLPKSYGGLEMDPLSYGLLTREIGKRCSSARTLLTVHLSLVAETIARWGTDSQKSTWLNELSRGNLIAAFCLSEASAGSDIGAIQTTYEEFDDCYVLNGAKKWTSFGAMAGLFLIIARNENSTSAFLVPSNTQGVSVKPTNGLMGIRGSMTSEVFLSDCAIPKSNLLGVKGLGHAQITHYALDHGRFSVAWGAVGLALACIEESIAFAGQREQFGKMISEHQLVKRRLTDMICEAKSAELLCSRAATLRRDKRYEAVIHTNIAKYYASNMAVAVAGEAVLIHGAMGYIDERPVERLYRDARALQIIEGTPEIHQLNIAEHGMKDFESLFYTS